jgi:exodeoxyribonuclease VII large subunit
MRMRLERASLSVAASLERVRAGSRLVVERKRISLDHLGARLQSLSPNATLARGYAVVRAGGHALREATAVAPGDRLEVELASGSLGARVEDVSP